MKKYNTTAVCIPSKHYMVDLSERVTEIKKMVDAGEYFTINRARQYGKTTIICPEIAISFAGNVSKAASLFRALYEKKSFSTEKVFEIAKDISDSGIRGDTDFIIAKL